MTRKQSVNELSFLKTNFDKTGGLKLKLHDVN